MKTLSAKLTEHLTENTLFFTMWPSAFACLFLRRTWCTSATCWTEEWQEPLQQTRWFPPFVSQVFFLSTESSSFRLVSFTVFSLFYLCSRPTEREHAFDCCSCPSNSKSMWAIWMFHLFSEWWQMSQFIYSRTEKTTNVILFVYLKKHVCAFLLY